MLGKFRREILYICVFLFITVIGKSNLDNVRVTIILNIFFLCLSLWYSNPKVILKPNNLLIVQIMHGLWSAILILCFVLAAYLVCFQVRPTFAFSIPNSSEYIYYFLFQILVAITEELMYRGCFYTIFEAMHIHKTIIIILISFIFGLSHFYLHESYPQFLSASIFSLALFIFMTKFNHYTLVSCISAHFIYNILCNYIIFLEL